MTIKELREKYRELADANGAILKKAHDDKRELLTADEDQEWNNRDAELVKLGSHIEKLERQEKLAKSLADPQERVVQSTNPAETRSSETAMLHLRKGQDDSMRALRTWLLNAPTSGYSPTEDDHNLARRFGFSLHDKMLNFNLSVDPMRSLMDRKTWEYRAQSVGVTTAGGFTVPDEPMRALEVALLTFGGMRQAATIIRTTSGAALPIPTTNDTTNVGVRLGENVQVANQDVAFQQLVLDAYKYSSKQILVSVELLQDSSVNIGGMIGGMLGERIGRISNTEFTLGTGSSMPNGIVPAATVGFTAANGSSQVTTWTYASIVELEHSVDPAYRNGAAFMMADSSLKKTKLLVDSTGRPLWAASIATGAPETLMGYPIIINQDMAAMAANAKSVLFGQLSKYLIRDVLGFTLLRLDERYADFHQVAFLGFARMDGDLLDAGTHPVKLFVNAAS